MKLGKIKHMAKKKVLLWIISTLCFSLKIFTLDRYLKRERLSLNLPSTRANDGFPERL
jgi:hypothetical protein